MANVIVCCDGLDPAYLDGVDTPGWDRIAEEGQSGTCSCAMPSLTNVNNVSIATGAAPDRHGITGNTYYDYETGQRVYMEDPSFVRHETRFQRAAARGEQIGVLVVKEKLRQMIGQGCVIAASAEEPPHWLTDAAGPAPDIYSGQASLWLLDAAEVVLDERDLDWLYVSTTDVVPHKHAPTDVRAIEWVKGIDEGVAALHERATEVAVTADHGMSRKRRCVDVESVLARKGYDATVVRLIRDKHTYHHQNLGGAAYVYHEGDVETVADHLASVEGIELALVNADAAERFDLPRDRIGDLLVLGDEETVFGPVEAGAFADVELRSHGSHHEREVPYATTFEVDLSANFEVTTAIRRC